MMELDAPVDEDEDEGRAPVGLGARAGRERLGGRGRGRLEVELRELGVEVGERLLGFFLRLEVLLVGLHGSVSCCAGRGGSGAEDAPREPE